MDPVVGSTNYLPRTLVTMGLVFLGSRFYKTRDESWRWGMRAGTGQLLMAPGQQRPPVFPEGGPTFGSGDSDLGVARLHR